MKKMVAMTVGALISMSIFGQSPVKIEKVKFDAESNALWAQYIISETVEGENLVLRGAVYDETGTTAYDPSFTFYTYGEDWLGKGRHSAPVFLNGTGLNSDNVEDGKPPVVLELAIVKQTGSEGDVVVSVDRFAVPQKDDSTSPAHVRGYLKTQTLNAALMQNWDTCVGVLTLKTSKINKDGFVSVSGTLMGLDGKKQNLKTTKIKSDEYARLKNVFQLKDGSALDVTIDEHEVWGTWGDNVHIVDDYTIGGDWTRSNAKVYVDFTSGPALPSGVQENLLPAGEPILPKGGRWAFNKAATVKLSQEVFCCGLTGQVGAVPDTSKGKTNLSALKLTYTPKTGLFKGSFKMYALENASNGKKRLKKYTANVMGVVVDGKGYGQAMIKNPALGPWTVTVE